MGGLGLSRSGQASQSGGGLSPSVSFSVGGSDNGFIFARSEGTIELEDDNGLTDSQRKALEALENLGAEGAT